jgi:hypothetical protein
VLGLLGKAEKKVFEAMECVALHGIGKRANPLKIVLVLKIGVANMRGNPTREILCLQSTLHEFGPH